MKSTISRMLKSAAAFVRPVLIAQALMVLLAVAVFSSSASARPSVYVVGLGPSGPQFGTVDLASGRFRHIANTPESLAGLVWWNESLLSLATSDPLLGYLVKINPATGEITAIGATGLGSNAFSFAKVGGKLYLTDFSNNLYSADPQTGAATFIRATGIPPDPNIPFTTNPDGTLNLCDETLFGAGGRLYATFDSINVLPATLEVNKYPADATVSPALYQIDPTTGVATQIGPTYLYLDASIKLDGTFYAFLGQLTGFPGGFPAAFSELEKVDVTTGVVTFLRVVDVSAGVIFGAADTSDEFGER
jgi:hypothetical protein